MAVALTWSHSELGSCLHAIDCIRRGLPLLDRRLLHAFRGACQELASERPDVPVDSLWLYLPPLACREHSPRALGAALNSALGEAPTADSRSLPFEAVLERCLATMRRCCPRLGADLTSRQRPLREQWEAVGPGLLLQVRRLIGEIDQEQETERQIHLVHPVCGGAGFAHPAYRSVRIEAVLTNSTPQLPETLRLAWLVAQSLALGSATPASAHSTSAVLRWALLPATLYAAEELDIARLDLPTLSLALEAWHSPCDSIQLGPEGLLAWWRESRSNQTPWRAALRTLAVLSGQRPDGEVRQHPC